MWSDRIDEYSPQRISLAGRVDACFKELPRGVTSSPGALNRDVPIAAQGDQLLPAFKLITVMPVPAAFRRDQKVQALAQRTLLG